MSEVIKWKRSVNGWAFGVCEGLGESFDINPNLIRAILLLSMFAFGTGLFIYIILGLTLPKEDELIEYHENKFLGVCERIAEKSEIELGLVRVFTIISFFASAGATLLFYIVLHFVLPQKKSNNSKLSF
jgi:phage shock protein PspC (stress-responsive transcriptional regulator)